MSDSFFSGETCPICLEKLKKTNVSITPCNHTFCTTCLLTSIQENNNCPLCRKELIKSKSRHEFVVEDDIQNDILQSSYEEIDIDYWINELEINDDDEFLRMIDIIILSSVEQTISQLINNPNRQLENENNLQQPILVEDLVDILN